MKLLQFNLGRPVEKSVYNYITSYNDNGKKCEQGLYKDGKRNGECISWYPNGEKELHAYFRNSRPCNIWIYWDKDGNYDWINMDLS